MPVQSVQIEDARSGAKTCSFGQIRLHSAYDPEKEASRFAEEASPSFKPEFILVTGPALSYCAPALKKKFPEARLCAARYCAQFSEYDKFWDKVFDGSKENGFLDEQIFSFMGERGISRCLFLSWKPSERAFPQEFSHVWKHVMSAVQKSRSLYATREFFTPVWTKNAAAFCALIQNTAEISAGSSPVIVAASGPSLMTELPFLKAWRDEGMPFFLIALSSAMLPLEAAGIEPDLCMSCDGGFWARRHLELRGKSWREVPLALPAEAAVPKEFFSCRTIVPLSYGDALEADFMRSCGIPAMRAERNGTVSGTAALFALSITSGPVYFCGLDLESGGGFAHAQPNALELSDALSDTRIRTAQTRLAPARFGSKSLEIYRSWFASHGARFGGRLFRLSEIPYKNPLGGSIRDVFADSVRFGGTPPKILKSSLKKDSCERKEILREFFDSTKEKRRILEELFPVEALNPESLEDSAKEKYSKFLFRLRRVLA